MTNTLLRSLQRASPAEPKLIHSMVGLAQDRLKPVSGWLGSSPGGTADVTGLSPQSSLRDSLAKHRNLYPSDKSLGYYQSSLRDEIHRGAVLCDTTASRYPFSDLPNENRAAS